MKHQRQERFQISWKGFLVGNFAVLGFFGTACLSALVIPVAFLFGIASSAVSKQVPERFRMSKLQFIGWGALGILLGSFLPGGLIGLFIGETLGQRTWFLLPLGALIITGAYLLGAATATTIRYMRNFIHLTQPPIPPSAGPGSSVTTHNHNPTESERDEGLRYSDDTWPYGEVVTSEQ